MDTLHEISKTYTSNDEYKNFITADKAAAKCISTKPRAKCKVPWETIAIREKWYNMKKASLLNERNPTNAKG